MNTAWCPNPEKGRQIVYNASYHQMKGDILMETRECKDCKNFRLHYVKYANGGYHAKSYDHCVKPRLKKRYANDKACSHFQ